MPATVSPDYVYLDYAATAPLCEEALEAMKPYLTCGRDNLALNMNANSLHSPGRAAFEAELKHCGISMKDVLSPEMLPVKVDPSERERLRLALSPTRMLPSSTWEKAFTSA